MHAAEHLGGGRVLVLADVAEAKLAGVKVLGLLVLEARLFLRVGRFLGELLGTVLFRELEHVLVAHRACDLLRSLVLVQWSDHPR
jgi:hypothetical protein